MNNPFDKTDPSNLLVASLMEEMDLEDAPAMFGSIGDREDVGTIHQIGEAKDDSTHFWEKAKKYGEDATPDNPKVHDQHYALARHYKPLNGFTLESGKHDMSAWQANAAHAPVEKTFEGNKDRRHLLHREGIKHYTTDSKDINNRLWALHKSGNKSPEYSHIESGYESHNNLGTHRNLKALDHLLTSHQGSPKDLTLYTGLRRNPGMMAEQHSKRHVFFPAYTSTSLSYHKAKRFSVKSTSQMERVPEDSDNHHVLRIHWPKGGNGAYIGHHSEYTTEKEFLLPRGLKLRIAKKPEIHSMTYDGITTHHHIWSAYPVSGHKLKK